MNPVMTISQVKDARRAVADGETIQQVAARLGLGYNPVYTAVTGKTWSSIHNPPPIPIGKLWQRRKRPRRECQNCGRGYRRGGTTERCGACSTYWYRHGDERPLSHHLRKGHHARLSTKQLASLYARYEAGDSVDTLVESLPFSAETLRRRFHEAGYEMRDNTALVRKLNAPLVRQMRERYYNGGELMIDLARESGINYQTVYDAISWRTWRKAGGPMPPSEAALNKKPCAVCEMLTAHESGLCRYCR